MKKVIAIALSVLLLLGMMPLAVFADETPVVQKVDLRAKTNTTVNRNSSAYLTIVSKSNTEDGYTLALEMDSELTLKSGVSGVIHSKEEQSSIFEIAAKSNAEIGNHKITVKALSSATQEVLQIKEFTLMVVDTNSSSSYGGSVTTAMANVSYMLSGGDAIYDGDINNITVSLYNRGGATLRNASLSLKLPAGLTLHDGSSSKYVGNFVTNKTVTADFPVICTDSITAGSYEIEVVATGLIAVEHGFGEDSYTTWEEKSVSESFFVPVKTGKVSSSGEVVTPILMVTDYSCGGSVTAGKNFGLGLTLQNTSKETLKNIKVTLASEFVPVGSSNSFYIESIAAGESVQKSLVMSSSRDSAQGRKAMTVEMHYETEGGKTFTSSDVISIPLVQETRLVVDNILDPGMLYAGDYCYLNVAYRNMGENPVRNLVISVEGNFNMEGNASYFVGNMAAGRQDNYGFGFYPWEVGDLTGSVTFTFEDADGNEHNIVKNFNFTVEENPSSGGEWTDDPQPMPQPGFVMPKWGYPAIGVAVLVIIIILVKIIKKRKAKKMEEFDLDA